MRKPCDTAGEILPVPPLIKEGTQKPPFVKPVLSFVEGGAAWFDMAHHRLRAVGFGNVAVMKRTFASRIAILALL